MGPIGQHWTVTNPWKPYSNVTTGTLVDGSGQVKPFSGLFYFENSGGCSYWCNISWIFLVHSGPDISYTFQSYYRSPNMIQLILFEGKNEMRFNYDQMEIVSLEEFMCKMRDYEQNVVKQLTLRFTSQTHQVEINW